jgi:hypothetical protein
MIIVSFAPDYEISSIAFWTSFSDFGSKAEVASSRTKINGFFIKALAIAILYFCPPDKFTTHAVPTNVSSPSSKLKTNSALAFFNASIQSYSVASLFPYNKLSLIVPIIITGS